MNNYRTGTYRYVRGSSTLEILIAFAILTLTFTSVIMVVFGNQSVSVDSQTNDEAIGFAQAGLEAARNEAASDFYGLTATTSTVASGPLSYTKTLSFEDVAPFTKLASSTVTWTDAGRTLSVVFSTLLTDAQGSITGDTCSPVLSGDWTKPEDWHGGYGYADFPSPTGATGMDVAGGRVYVTSDPHSATTDDFYVVDVSDPKPAGLNLPILGSYDTTYGLTSVQVSGKYAYVAADSATNQLLIIDKSTPSAMSVVGQLDVTAPGDSAYGNTLYYDYATHRAYLGLTKSTGDEFDIIDVSNPAAPGLFGGYKVDSEVNQIIATGTVAYLATASSSQVIELDVSNPASPHLLRSFADDSSGLLTGQSLYLSGDTLYVGRIGGGHNADNYYQLFALDATTLSVKWQKTIALAHQYDGINRMILRSNLLFMATGNATNGFEIWDVSGGSPVRYDTTPLNIQQVATAGFDCEGNLLFVGERSNRALQIIGPS